jgi:Cysteine-rich secretory protein family
MIRTACLALIIALAAAPAQPQVKDDEGDWLAAHNDARDDVGLAPLAWSDRLAADARQWARHLARNNLYDHASPQQRKGQGENLWRGSRGYWDARTKIGFFIEEKRHFRSGNFPEVSRTGRWSDVAHYTQIIWPQTREVGCAVAHTATDEVLVCRYWPAGNVWGQRIDPDEHIARR